MVKGCLAQRCLSPALRQESSFPHQCPFPAASSRWRSLRRSDCLQRREIGSEYERSLQRREIGSEYEGEQRHADVHAILHFNKVGRARVSIHVG